MNREDKTEITPSEGDFAPDPNGNIRIFITKPFSSEEPPGVGDLTKLLTQPLAFLIDDLEIPDVDSTWKVVTSLPNHETIMLGQNGTLIVTTMADAETVAVTYVKQTPEQT